MLLRKPPKAHAATSAVPEDADLEAAVAMTATTSRIPRFSPTQLAWTTCEDSRALPAALLARQSRLALLPCSTPAAIAVVAWAALVAHSAVVEMIQAIHPALVHHLLLTPTHLGMFSLAATCYDSWRDHKLT